MVDFKFSIVLIFACLLCIWVQDVRGQITHAQRLVEIKSKLEELSEVSLPSLSEITEFSVSQVPLQSFLRTLAETHQLNIQIDPSLSIIITNNFTGVRVKDLLYFICEEYQLDIRFTETIMSVSAFQNPLPATPIRIPDIIFYEETQAVTLNLDRDTLSSVVRHLTRKSGKNILISRQPEVENRLITCFLIDMPLEKALEKIAITHKLEMHKDGDGVFVFGNAPNDQPLPFVKTNGPLANIQISDSLLTVDVENFPVKDLISQTASVLSKSFLILSDPPGTITIKTAGIQLANFLQLILEGRNFTFIERDGVFIVGPIAHESMRITKMISIKYRPVDGLEKEIPTELMRDVEIKPVKELNCYAITGNRFKIDVLENFIREIDKPVANILIEVIVVDVRKGFSFETGLRAFLSDSVPKTGGQMFPSVDLTVGSGAINKTLETLDSKGIVKLGKVTPNFYVTLQAMEQNNNIQVRSTPKLSTINGNRANLVIGESVYYVEQTQNITGGINPITTTAQRFNKVEANLSVSITPFVSGNGHITLDISAEFSDFINPTIPNAPPGNATRKFESKIRVRNEEMIILGGLEELSNSESGSGTPFLSRVPIIKWFFSSRSKRQNDNRLIIFIRPILSY